MGECVQWLATKVEITLAWSPDEHASSLFKPPLSSLFNLTGPGAQRPRCDYLLSAGVRLLRQFSLSTVSFP